MKYFILLALLPCIWAFNETHVECPDQTSCPKGKTCCYNFDPEEFYCCEVEKHEKDNKKLIPAIPSYKNNSDEVVSSCPDDGKLCGDGLCCKYKAGECCSNSTSCCPDAHRCCSAILNGTTTVQTWCCGTKQRCADTYLYCISGSSCISSSFLSLVMILIVTVSLKHF